MRRTTLVAALLLTAGLAGCLGGGEADAADEDLEETSDPSNNGTARPTDEANQTEQTPAEQGPAVEVVWFNGSVRGQAAPLVGPFCVETCDNQFTVEVEANASELLAEITWEAEASLMFDLDVPYDRCETGMAEDCRPGSVSGAEGYLSIHLAQASDIVEGNWTASAWAEDSPTQPVDFTIAVSLAEHELPDSPSRLPG